MDYLEWRRLQNEELDPDNVSLHAALGVIDSITDDQWLSREHHDLLVLAFSFVPEGDDSSGEILDTYHARLHDFQERQPEPWRLGMMGGRSDDEIMNDVINELTGIMKAEYPQFF